MTGQPPTGSGRAQAAAARTGSRRGAPGWPASGRWSCGSSAPTLSAARPQAGSIREDQMTATDEPGRHDVVTALRRPPVRQSTLVRASAEHTFATFVTRIGAWWPVRPFSAGQDRVRAVTVEQRRGGRVYETWDDGTEVDWGTLLAWQPPERFTMTWTGTPAPTEVELTFTPLGPALTRVTVE